MTNFEFYKDKITKIDGNGIPAFGLRNGEPYECSEIGGCEMCDFYHHNSTTCNIEKLKWLFAEHVEKPKLTRKERLFCELMGKGYICRDKDGEIDWTNASISDVIKNNFRWYDTGGWGKWFNISLIGDESWFSFIKWNDEKPWAVEDLLKLEVEE